MIFCRPVTQRAILMAFSLASAPPLVKNALVRLPGVISCSSRPKLGAHRRGGGRRRDVADLLHLRLDGVDDALVAVADVDAHELRVEVHVALAVGVPEVDALGVVHDQRLDRALRRPLVERGLAREVEDLLPAQVANRHRQPPM